ncbi:S8 family serine peptidase [Streptomyces lincolnensis]|uniref:S8 family peptidase n=1 Tax=Streptomyces lincolnensis TaxID=1915 RepID=UPI001E5507C7|nr:S8 family serine peptidase [Streptomyces lincolnensis]MCD7444431.1 S8 family serine peptidase [Streptomyces lincolnensis]
MNNNRRRAALACTLLLSAFSLGSAPAFAAAPASAAAQTADTGASGGPAQRVIVVMRDQLTDLPMRTQAARRSKAAAEAQAPVMARLKESGATHVSGMSLINAVSATLKPDAIARIRGDRDVAAVVPDLPIRQPATARATEAPTTPAANNNGIGCPKDPAKPLAEPEALSLTHTDAAHRTATGKGVKVAFFAEGMDADNPEFIRPDGSHVVTDTEDFGGDGVNAPTGGGEAFGDASAIAAQGSRTYDLATQLPHAKLPKGCTFRVRGFAPGAELMDLKVYGAHAYTSGFVRAIQYAVEHHADVLSQSFGGNNYPDAATDPVRLADDAAIAAGVTVVASSGDSGTSGTVGSPASDPDVIGVGATTSFRLAAQAYGYRKWTNDNIAALSSGGTTPDNKVVDLVAPGMVGMAACTVDKRWSDCTLPTQVFGGTSQSAPFVAGAAADVIQAYKDTHGGVRPSPDLVKRLLTGTATDLRTPADEQGAGLLNTHAAVQAARAIDTVDRHADQLVPSVGQLSVTGQPGSARQTSVSLTNTADRPQRVTMTSRTVGTQTFRTQRKVTVGAPLTGDDREGRLAAKPFTVKVPKGTPLLDAEMVWPGTDKSGKLALILVDPAGALTQVSYDYDGYGLHSNYQHVDVHDPRPGTWTVKVVWNNGRMHLQDKPLEPGSYRGPVDVRITGHRYTTAGVPAQTRTVPAGGTATFPVRIPFARTAGDTPFSLQFASDTGTRLSLPVARRTLIPVDPAAGHSTSFAATITGGVGRDVGQTNGYFIDVPPGRRGLTIDLTAEDPAPTLVYYLISPDGQVLARDTDRTAGENGAPTKYASLSANRPAGGRWTLIIGLPDAVSGKAFSQQVTGKVRLDAATATAPGLPDSPSRVLKRGSTLTVPVRVPNSGPAERHYYLDPRLDTTGEIKVPVWGDDKSGTVQINQGGPAWVVPSHTTEVIATATADRPVDLNIYPWTGAPAVFAPAGPTGTTVATAHAGQLASGTWSTDVTDPGPFGDKPAGKGTAKVSVTATTQSFDPAAKASTGEFWNPDADWNPVTAAAGKTATMTLTLTPTAPVGTVVHGTVYVDTDTSFGGLLGSELIGIPYTYTVG